MLIQENTSLVPYNTFGIDATARYFGKFSSIEELTELLSFHQRKTPSRTPLLLGGGSNILFAMDFDGLIMKNEVRGIVRESEDDEFVYIKAGAGENWHQFVQYCIQNNWAGLENLSLIPGCVGASPMQNIGAYGVEISEVFHELKAFHLHEKANYQFGPKDCAFGYRDSVFKNKYKDQFAIQTVTFRLRKIPEFNTSYGAIGQELDKMGVKDLSIAVISQAVINIRTSKLPDPKEIGNAGSFFKNPLVSKSEYLAMQTKFPGIVGYPNPDGTMKLAAGWLIEHSGPADLKELKDFPNRGTVQSSQSIASWKGFRRGDAGCHAKQALVLVNYGHASGKDIFDLSEDILQSVGLKFGVILEREVNII